MVKTNAPGAFGCEVFLKAWALGDRRPGCYVMEHIDNCWFCRDIVHGGTDEFPLSIEDEARRNIERRSRRNFFRYVAASVGGLALAGMGAASFYSGAPSIVDLGFSREFKAIDKKFFLGGTAYVDKTIRRGSKPELKMLMFWIEDRRRSQFYGRLVDLCGHADPEIRSVAITRLRNLPPIDLRPHAPRIDQVRTASSSAAVQALLGDLLVRIANA